MIKVDCPQVQTLKAAAISSAILVIVRRIKHVFELEQKFDDSNPYIKIGRNPITND